MAFFVYDRPIGSVISEWTTEKEAREQVNRFNKSANGEYYEVKKHVSSNVNE
jgi:hypothetical protein